MTVRYIVVGSNGIARKLDDAGTWSTLSLSAGTDLLGYVWGFEDHIYIGTHPTLGSAPKLYRSTDGGDSWTDISADLPGLPTSYLIRGIHGYSQSAVYVAACGPPTSSGMRLYRYDGATWTQIRTDTHRIAKVWAFAADDVYYCEPNNNSVYHYNGSSWSAAFTVSGIDGPAGFFGVSASDFWAFVEAEAARYNGAVWDTTTHTGFAFGQLNQADGEPGGQLWVTDNAGCQHWNGSTWSLSLAEAVLSSSDLLGVAAYSESDVLCGGFGGAAGRYNGASWTVIPAATTGFSSQNIYSIWSPKDGDPPYVTARTPAVGKHTQGPRGPITFTITDDASSVDSASVRISVNNVEIYDGADFAIGWTDSTVTPSSGDVSVTLASMFDLDQRVTLISVTAADTAGNSDTISWVVLIPLAAQKRLPGWLITDAGSLDLDGGGHIKRDGTITRARIRLRVRQGEWFGSPDIGSRLHQIQITKNAAPRLRAAVTEALQPLLDDGSILSIGFDSIEVDPVDGKLGASITIALPGDTAVPLGVAKIG